MAHTTVVGGGSLRFLAAAGQKAEKLLARVHRVYRADFNAGAYPKQCSALARTHATQHKDELGLWQALNCTEVDLRGNPSQITDRTLQILSECKTVRDVKLGSAFRITDAGIAMLTSVVSLQIGWCQHLTSDAVSGLRRLRKLRATMFMAPPVGLTHLALNRATIDDARAFAQAIKDGNIDTLELTQCLGLTQHFVAVVAGVRLSVLCLAQCRLPDVRLRYPLAARVNVAGATLKELLVDAGTTKINVRRLNVSMPLETHATLVSIATTRTFRCWASLVDIDVSCGPTITDSFCMYMHKKCPALRTCNVSNCTRISARGISLLSSLFTIKRVVCRNLPKLDAVHIELLVTLACQQTMLSRASGEIDASSARMPYEDYVLAWPRKTCRHGVCVCVH